MIIKEKDKKKKEQNLSPSFFSQSNADLALKKPTVEIRTVEVCVCVCVYVGQLPRIARIETNKRG